MIDLKTETKWLAIVAVVASAVFINSLAGGFVYDDNRQIVRNPLIQDSSLHFKALTSDIWAFKGDGTIAASNYYRPTFAGWLILNFYLFGLNPFGWHLLNLLLHVVVSTLAFLLLRRWNASPVLSFCIALIFAVHPVHVESVSWISGSPDLLFTAALLISFWFVENWRTKRKTHDLLLSLLFYAIALGAKEVAMLCFPIYFLLISRDGDEPTAKDGVMLSPTLAGSLFAFAAIGFFVLRWRVLGEITHSVEDSTGLYNAVLTAPHVFLFYVRQIVLPITLAGNYPLRPVEVAGFLNFVLPLVITIGIFAVFLLMARRSFFQKIGLALFVLPLLPVLNISAFPSEQIVHDRYLYLPLLGFLMMVAPEIEKFLLRTFPNSLQAIVPSLLIVIAVPLAFQTYLYNRVWSNNLALWQHNTKVDPNSASNLTHLASELQAMNRHQEALDALNNSIKIKNSAPAVLGRGRSLLYLKRFDEAVPDLQWVISLPNEEINAYTLYQSYESLAIALTSLGKLDEAQRTLVEARVRLPIYSAALTEKLAIVLYQAGNKPAALSELEAAKEKAKTELLPESKSVLLRLGMLYAELGRKDEARRVLQEYLSLTAQLKDSVSLTDREQAAILLRKLS